MALLTVLGASGTTGSRVARGLEAGGHQVRRASRTSTTHFDWDDRTTWEPALSGAQGVYVVPDERPGGVDRLADLLSVAEGAAVERIALLSARDWIDTDLPDGHLREDAVRASGLAWTIIRPAWFAQDFQTIPCFAHGITTGRLVHACADGATAFVDAQDIADVAVAALGTDGHGHRHYEVSGRDSVSMDTVARTISAVTDRRVVAEAVSLDEYEQYLRSLGEGDDVVHAMGFFCREMREGHLDRVSEGVQQALGRPAHSFGEFASATDW